MVAEVGSANRISETQHVSVTKSSNWRGLLPYFIESADTECIQMN